MTVVHEYAAAEPRRRRRRACRVHRGLRARDRPVPAHGAKASGRHEWRLEAFFAAFPDYDVTLDGLLEGEREVAAWGVVRATMRGDLLSQTATGRAFELPMSCVFTLDGGRLAGESFFFDLNQMCEQLGLSHGGGRGRPPPGPARDRDHPPEGGRMKHEVHLPQGTIRYQRGGHRRAAALRARRRRERLALAQGRPAPVEGLPLHRPRLAARRSRAADGPATPTSRRRRSRGWSWTSWTRSGSRRVTLVGNDTGGAVCPARRGERTRTASRGSC